MPTPNEMKQVTHERVSKDKKGYFSTKKIFQKIREEKEKFEDAINHLFLTIRYAENVTDSSQREKRQEDRIDAKQYAELEMGDLFFALACLSNIEGIDMDRSYYYALKKHIWQNGHFREKIKWLRHANSFETFAPQEGWSYWPKTYRHIATNKVLFSCLNTSIYELQDLIEHSIGGMNEKREKQFVKDIQKQFGDVLWQILNIGIPYDLYAEDAFLAMMEKNNKRSENNYQKEEK